MTLTQLQEISAACKTDAEFLAHPEVRRKMASPSWER